MNMADLVVQGVDLELAKSRLDGAINDISRMKVMIEELLDEADPELQDGSRFRKLVVIKCLLNSAGIDTYGASRSVASALKYQQDALPTPETC